MIYDDLKTERVLRWRLLLEEFIVDIRYIEGKKNIVADVLSRYPSTNDPDTITPQMTEEQSELFATENDMPADAFPLSFKILSTFQQRDAALAGLVTSNKRYARKSFHGGEQLVCYDEKIFVPTPLRRNVITWYHEYLCHPGETRTE